VVAMVEPESNHVDSHSGPPGGPIGPGTGHGDYRHSVDLRFVLPTWRGRCYVDLRIGRDKRAVQRPHVVPRRVRRMNAFTCVVAVQMACSWLTVLAMLFYWGTQSACGNAGGVLSLPGEGVGPAGDRYTVGAPEYVSVSAPAEQRVGIARALIRELASADIGRELDSVGLYYADTLYIALDHGQSYDGVALPLGNRIVLWRAYVESADIVSLAALYVHELQHMLQSPGFVGSRAGEDEAGSAEQDFLRSLQEFSATDAYVRWASDHHLPEADLVAARSLAMTRSADGRLTAPEPFACGTVAAR